MVDLSKEVIVVWNRFDLGAHVERMRRRHPEWTRRQLRNCYYWQGTARKQLRERVHAVTDGKCLSTTYCPEGNGVDVTATMSAVGIRLDWPPKRWAYQVALVGCPVGRGIPCRRVNKVIDDDRDDRRFVMESQSFGGRKVAVVIKCRRCGAFTGLRGRMLAATRFRCSGCGIHGNMTVVRRQVRRSDKVVFGGSF
jgi:hypothetical protein